MRKAAQLLGTGRTRLFRMVRRERIFPKGQNTPYQCYIERGYFTVKERTYTNGEQSFVHATTFVTGKGLTWLAQKLFGQKALTVTLGGDQ